MEKDLLLAQKLEPYNVKRYLEASGWASVPCVLSEVICYRRKEPKPGQEFQEILIPASRDVSHYARTVIESVQRLSEFDSMPRQEVWNYLQNPKMDRISYRLISEQADFGTINLAGAEQFFGGIINAIKASLRDSRKPSVFHPRLSGDGIESLLENSRFGQTEKGSFIVNIYIPIDPPGEQEMVDGFENCQFRKGLEHLMRSMTKVCDVIDKGDVDQFEEQNMVNPEISCNLLAAVRDTCLWDDAEIEIQAHWSPIVPTDAPQTVQLSKSVFPVFDQWIRRFRPSKTEIPFQEFRGQVKELRGRKHDGDENTYGEVLISVIADDCTPFDAKVNLTSVELYQMAIRSHAKNKFVKFRGHVIREHRTASILNIENFQLDESAADDIEMQ